MGSECRTPVVTYATSALLDRLWPGCERRAHWLDSGAFIVAIWNRASDGEWDIDAETVETYEAGSVDALKAFLTKGPS